MRYVHPRGKEQEATPTVAGFALRPSSGERGDATQVGRDRQYTAANLGGRSGMRLQRGRNQLCATVILT